MEWNDDTIKKSVLELLNKKTEVGILVVPQVKDAILYWYVFQKTLYCIQTIYIVIHAYVKPSHSEVIIFCSDFHVLKIKFGQCLDLKIVIF